MTGWLSILPTPNGAQPFALTLTEGACNLLLALFSANGVIGACVQYFPGVAS